MPPMQPFQPAQSMPGDFPNMGANSTPLGNTSPNGMPMVQQVQLAPVQKKDISGLVKTIAIIVLSLIAATFIGLFIWMTLQYDESKTDLDGKIAVAVAEAKDEQTSKMEAEFLEREKYPYSVFSGPVDYGQLSFEYPKTWSVYVDKAATSAEGGDFNAYLNPIQVDSVGKETINALRVTIIDEDISKTTEKYKKEMEKKDANLTMASVTIGVNNNITADRYTGKIPKTELNGFIVVFKIRDKTAILQTDSVLFQAEFDKLLGTVTFNE